MGAHWKRLGAPMFSDVYFHNMFSVKNKKTAKKAPYLELSVKYNILCIVGFYGKMQNQ